MATTLTTQANTPLFEQPAIHSRRWFLLGIMCLSLVLVVMSVAGLNTALPTMQQELGASASELQWIVDAYAVLFAGLLLTAGALGDRFGRKPALIAGLLIFAAERADRRVGDRGHAVDRQPSPHGCRRGIHHAGHPVDHHVDLPTPRADQGHRDLGRLRRCRRLDRSDCHRRPTRRLLVGLDAARQCADRRVGVAAAVWAFSPSSRDDTRTPLDPGGALLSLVGLSALIFGIIQGPENGWTSTPVVAAFATSAISLGLFVWWERRAEHPMLPMNLFRDRRFSVGSGAITASFFVMFGFFFLMTQYLQFGRSYSPLEAGLASLPLALTFVAVSPRSAALANRYGAPRLMAAGLGIVALGFGLLTTLSTDTPYLVIAFAFAILGAGMGITAAPATGEIMSSVPLSKAGVGSAVNDTTRELGGALGIALLGSIANSVYRANMDTAGIGLPGEAAHAAGESIGAASGIARILPNGGELIARAGSAFTDAFKFANGVAVAIAVATAVGILAWSRGKGTEPDVETIGSTEELDLGFASVGASE